MGNFSDKYQVKAKTAICIVTLIVFCASLLALACWPAYAYAKKPLKINQGASAGSNAFVYNNNEYYNFSKSADGTEQNSDSQESENTLEDQDASTNVQQQSLPSRYLLTVDKLTATPLRNQGCMGTCWAFGVMGAAESSIINAGLADTSLDLSERHLAWFEHTPLANEVAGKDGEGYNIVCPDGSAAQNSASWRVVNLGGFTASAYKLFATCQGPVLDSTCPYNATATTALNAAYTGDWSVPETSRFTNMGIELTDCNFLPSVYVKNKGTSTVGINAVKAEIAEGRCVATGIHNATTYTNSQHDTAYTNGGHAYEYTYSNESSNHEVTIVGYDDTIPASTFAIGSNVPAGNGGFLVKDSQGSNYGVHADGSARSSAEVAAGTGGGYFWVSYYDQSLNDQISFKFQASSGQTLHAYDYVGNATNYLQGLTCTEDEEPVSVANVYTATQNESVNEVAFESLGNADTVTVQVKLLAEDTEENAAQSSDSSSDSGSAEENTEEDENQLTIEGCNLLKNSKTIATESNLQFSSGGFHRIKLSNAAIIPAGRKYAVVITHAVGNNTYALPYTVVRRSVNNADSGYRLLGSTLTCNSIVNRGESLVVQGDNASDIVDVASTLSADRTYQNFTINAYTTQVTDEDVQAAYPPVPEIPVSLIVVVGVVAAILLAAVIALISHCKHKPSK